MIYRTLKPGRLVIALVAICGLWWMYQSECDFIIPGRSRPAPVSRIAKVTVAANALNSSLIQKALETHQVQNDLHGYVQYIATDGVVADITENDPQRRPRGAWSKPAYLLSIIVAELTKPEAERSTWVFWFDADTVVTNPYTPLEIFLPPESMPELADIHLLMASNWDGLNSGAFALRVHPWSVSLLSAVLAYPIYKKELLKTNRFRDQSAFQWLLQDKGSPMGGGSMRQRENWAEVPMRWFNSLPINNAFSVRGDWIFNYNMTNATFDKGTNEVYKDGNGGIVKPWKVMQGDMIVHFAGTNPVRDSWMGPWLNRAQQYLPEWANSSTKDVLKVEATKFWEETSRRRIQAFEFERTNVIHASQAKLPPAQATNRPVARSGETRESTLAKPEPEPFKLRSRIVSLTGRQSDPIPLQRGKWGT